MADQVQEQNSNLKIDMDWEPVPGDMDFFQNILIN